MDAKRELVVKLFLKNEPPRDIFKKLKVLGVNRRFIFRTIKRFKETGSWKISPKPGLKRSVRTPHAVKLVRERIRRNPNQSGRKMARQLGVSQSSMQRILKKDLGLTAYRKQRVHGLTNKQKVARVQRCRNLLKRHASCEILFSDEKMFLLQDQHNQQNDRVYAAQLSEIPRNNLAIQRFQNVSRVMVFGCFSKNWKLPLLFIEPNVKINTGFYVDNVLKTHVLPLAKQHFKNQPYCFQQDSAPSHQSKTTQNWCKNHFPDFISTKEWPSSSPDLNPLDFFAWGYMLSKVGSTKGLTMTTFKRRLVKIWDEMPLDAVRASCEAFPKRMRLVIKAKGERFELD
jgi:inhibitor of nuclear factor kappa-B kinase subunit alpha